MSALKMALLFIRLTVAQKPQESNKVLSHTTSLPAPHESQRAQTSPSRNPWAHDEQSQHIRGLPNIRRLLWESLLQRSKYVVVYFGAPIVKTSIWVRGLIWRVITRWKLLDAFPCHAGERRAGPAKKSGQRVSATQANQIFYSTILYSTLLYYTILFYSILYYTILYYTILYYTILYYTILYYTAQHSTAQHSTAQHSTATSIRDAEVSTARVYMKCRPSQMRPARKTRAESPGHAPGGLA